MFVCTRILKVFTTHSSSEERERNVLRSAEPNIVFVFGTRTDYVGISLLSVTFWSDVRVSEYLTDKLRK